MHRTARRPSGETVGKITGAGIPRHSFPPFRDPPTAPACQPKAPHDRLLVPPMAHQPTATSRQPIHVLRRPARSWSQVMKRARSAGSLMASEADVDHLQAPTFARSRAAPCYTLPPARLRATSSIAPATSGSRPGPSWFQRFSNEVAGRIGITRGLQELNDEARRAPLPHHPVRFGRAANVKRPSR